MNTLTRRFISLALTVIFFAFVALPVTASEDVLRETLANGLRVVIVRNALAR